MCTAHSSLVSKTEWCFSQSQGHLYFSFPTVWMSKWQSKAIVCFNHWTSLSHSCSTYCFPSGFDPAFLLLSERFPMSSRWIRSGKTEPVHKLGPDLHVKGSEFMGKAPCWLQRIVEQMQTRPNNWMSHLWQQTPCSHPCLDEGTEDITSGLGI